MLARTLVIACILWIAYRLFIRDRKTPIRKDNGMARMLRCDVCSVHLPEREAIMKGDRVFCSHEHAGLSQKSQS